MFKTFGKILKNRIFIMCFAIAMVFFSMTALSVPTSKTLANTVITERILHLTTHTQCSVVIGT